MPRLEQKLPPVVVMVAKLVDDNWDPESDIGCVAVAVIAPPLIDQLALNVPVNVPKLMLREELLTEALVKDPVTEGVVAPIME